MKEFKINEIQKIIKDFEESNLMSMELEIGDLKLKLSKNKIEERFVREEHSDKLTNNQEVLNEQINLPKNLIKSPLVGTFYESSSPNSKPFVEVGSIIKKGDVVCIIEAMKIMNEIKSNLDGKIAEVMFKNGDVVGFNDVLFKVIDNANTK